MRFLSQCYDMNLEAGGQPNLRQLHATAPFMNNDSPERQKEIALHAPTRKPGGGTR